MAIFNDVIQNTIYADISVTCSTTTTITTNVSKTKTEATNTTTWRTLPTTASENSGFDILVILSVLIMGSIFEIKKRRK